MTNNLIDKMNELLMSPGYLSSFLDEEIYLIKSAENKTVIPEYKEPVISETGTGSVVDEPEPAELKVTTIAVEEIPEINFFGGYRKNIVFLISDAGDLFISGADKEFLGNILNAIHLNFNDVAIVNLFRQQELDLKQVIKKMHPVSMLAFGIAESFFPKKMDTGIHLIEGLQVLYCPWSLGEISRNVEFKRVLWKSLKEMFQV